jgi:hypothetical protein
MQSKPSSSRAKPGRGGRGRGPGRPVQQVDTGMDVESEAESEGPGPGPLPSLARMPNLEQSMTDSITAAMRGHIQRAVREQLAEMVAADRQAVAGYNPVAGVGDHTMGTRPGAVGPGAAGPGPGPQQLPTNPLDVAGTGEQLMHGPVTGGGTGATPWA